MALEQPPQLPTADAKASGQGLDVGVLAVQRTVGDERQSPAHRVGRAVPEGEVRCDLGPAAQAGPKACLLGSGRRGKEAAVLEPGRTRGANRPAIDASRGAGDENVAVEAGVAALESAVASPVIEQFHSGTLLHTCA